MVDWETLQHHPDATPGQCRIYRTSDVFFDPGRAGFPLAEYRKVEERLVRLPRQGPADEEPTRTDPLFTNELRVDSRLLRDFPLRTTNTPLKTN